MTDFGNSTTSNSVSAQSNSLMPWARLIALTFAAFATVTVEMLPSGLLPQIGRGLGVDPSLVGTLVAAWAITIVLTSMPLVRVTIGVRRGWLIPASLGVVALATLLMALAPTFGIALLCRVVAAAGHGVFWAVIVVYVVDIVPVERLGRALALVLSGPSIAGFVGLPLGTASVDVVGWRAIFGFASVVLGSAAIALALMLARTDEESDAATSDASSRLQSSRLQWDRSAIASVGTAVAGALVLVGHFTLFTYVAMLITGVANFESGSVAVVLVIFGASGAAGIAVSGLLSDRWPRATLPASGVVLLLAFIAFTFAPTVPAVFWAAVVAWGAAVGLLPAAMQARVLRLASPRFRPAAGSVVVTVLNLGVAVGAALGACVVDTEGAHLAPVALFTAALGVAGLLHLSRVPDYTTG